MSKRYLTTWITLTLCWKHSENIVISPVMNAKQSINVENPFVNSAKMYEAGILVFVIFHLSFQISHLTLLLNHYCLTMVSFHVKWYGHRSGYGTHSVVWHVPCWILSQCHISIISRPCIGAGVGNFLCGRQGPVDRTQSIAWLLMAWRRKEPRHQRPWYWLVL